MQYLVLGSSGQIGATLCDYHRKNGDHVETFDIVESSYEDLRTPNNTLLKHKMEQCDFVYFLAFDVGGSRYLQKYQRTFNFVHNNMKLMVNTFQALRHSGKPFIFVSSQMAEMHHSSYGNLKKIGEEYTKILGGLVVKLWNVYGVEEDLNKSHVVTDFILQAQQGGIKMLTDGKEMRQFLFSEDCCEALHILSNKYGEIDRENQLHLSSFEWVSIFDLAKNIMSLKNETSDKIESSETTDWTQQDARIEPDPYILNYWKPKTSLREGLEKLWEYHYDN